MKFSKSRGTSRWAVFEPQSTMVSEKWQIGVVDNAKITEALNSHPWYGTTDTISLGEMVYRLFSPKYITSFEQFATTKYKDPQAPAPYLSLEYVHNNIHNWTGGFDQYIGHMAEPAVAGFDPIFWMHHW
jgi:tyrosinase